MLTINSALLRKYDLYGPRYTSYPTALQFTPSVGENDFYTQMDESNQDPIPKPISLYLHIPFCHYLCFYCGCHKVITHSNTRTQNYFQTLKQELAMQAKLVAEDRHIQQIHFGGGTPTFYETSYIRDILDTIRSLYSVVNDCEIAIEIDPRTTTKHDIQDLANMGFNRMSFGIQDFDRNVQIAINRIQHRQETLNLMIAAREAGVSSLSVDLIYGLPKQTPTSFKKTLDEIIRIRPNRIALYHYAHMPQRIKSQRLINSDAIPPSNIKLDLFTNSIRNLSESGYCYIGMDHFALPDDSLSKSLDNGTLQRNFQGYSTNGDCDIIGMGVSAISKVGNLYSQNIKDTKTYQAAIENNELAIERGYLLAADDHVRGSIIHSIMCSQKVCFENFTKTYDLSFNTYFASELDRLQPFINDDLIIYDNNSLTVTSKGRLFLRNIAMIFDCYLYTKNEDSQVIKFSKVL